MKIADIDSPTQCVYNVIDLPLQNWLPTYVGCLLSALLDENRGRDYTGEPRRLEAGRSKCYKKTFMKFRNLFYIVHIQGGISRADIKHILRNGPGILMFILL